MWNVDAPTANPVITVTTIAAPCLKEELTITLFAGSCKSFKPSRYLIPRQHEAVGIGLTELCQLLGSCVIAEITTPARGELSLQFQYLRMEVLESFFRGSF